MAIPELIESYVDRDAVLPNFATTGFEAVETEVAVEAIVTSRAQFVVDAVTAELRVRGEQLHARRAGLQGELSLVDEEIEIVNLALGTQSANSGKTPGDLSEAEAWVMREEHDGLWRDFAKIDDEDQFINAISKHPQLYLRLDRSGKVTPFDWNYMGRRRLVVTTRFPEARHTVTKAYGLLSRHSPLTVMADESTQDQWGIVQEQSADPGSKLAGSVKIEDPARFFVEAFKIAGFGISCAKAVLAVAYIQAEESRSSCGGYGGSITDL